LKILQIVPSYWPAKRFGGPIFSLFSLNKALVRKGIDLTVYTTNVGLGKDVPSNEKISIEGIKVNYFNFVKCFEWLGPTGWQFSPVMEKALKKSIKDFDLIYIVGVWNYPIAMAARCCLKFKKPYIISPRGMLYPFTMGRKLEKKSIYYNLVIKDILKSANAIHYTTEDEAEKCHSFLGLRNRKIVISNGIDLLEFSDLSLGSKFRERYPVLKDKKVILFLGRIDRIKGLDILIKAYSILAKENNEVHLFIAGDGEGGYKEKVEEEVINLGLQERVTFSGFLNGKEKLEAYMGSDIFVLPSYSENFGLSAVEAMACALPVVISDKVGISGEVKDRNSGIIVETNAESVYYGLKKLLEDEGLRKELSENGRLLVKEHYDINKVADKMIKVFGEMSSERFM